MDIGLLQLEGEGLEFTRQFLVGFAIAPRRLLEEDIGVGEVLKLGIGLAELEWGPGRIHGSGLSADFFRLYSDRNGAY